MKSGFSSQSCLQQQLMFFAQQTGILVNSFSSSLVFRNHQRKSDWCGGSPEVARVTGDGVLRPIADAWFPGIFSNSLPQESFTRRMFSELEFTRSVQSFRDTNSDG
jgi:hypothetical protein